MRNYGWAKVAQLIHAQTGCDMDPQIYISYNIVRVVRGTCAHLTYDAHRLPRKERWLSCSAMSYRGYQAKGKDPLTVPGYQAKRDDSLAVPRHIEATKRRVKTLSQCQATKQERRPSCSATSCPLKQGVLGQSYHVTLAGQRQTMK